MTANCAPAAEAIRSRHRRAEAGITLIELLVVLTILGLISALVVINVLPEADKAKQKTARIDIGNIETALDQYKLDNFNYPSSEQGLRALVTPPGNLARPENYRPGGYIRGSLPIDPWGNPYQYRFPGERGLVDVFSFGADGQQGGEGQNADIGNWTNAG